MLATGILENALAPYQGGGIPPEKLERLRIPLGKRLQIALMATFVNQAQRQQLQQHAPEMHRALVVSFPAMPELLKLLQQTPKP